MSAQYSTALSHIILAGTGIYCLIGAWNHILSYPRISFSLITANSLVGVWRWGNPTYGSDAAKLYTFTSFVQEAAALPCIVSTIWLSYGYMWEPSHAHALVSLLPIISPNYELVDYILGVNCISLGVVSFINQNYFGVAASISYAFSHFIVKNDETYFDVPSQDFYNYTMCFFALFALKAVMD